MDNYLLIEQRSTHNTKICTYGIKCISNGCLISDISTNKKEVERMCTTFNLNNLSPIHFTDAVEDFLVLINS